MPSTIQPGVRFASEFRRRPQPQFCTTFTISRTTAPTASPFRFFRNHSAWQVILFPLADAIARDSFFTVILTSMGASYSSLGSISTSFGYHSFTTGCNFSAAQSHKSGVSVVSIVILYFSTSTKILCAVSACTKTENSANKATIRKAIQTQALLSLAQIVQTVFGIWYLVII